MCVQDGCLSNRSLHLPSSRYGYTDGDLQLMCERYGSLSAHMEEVLVSEAAHSEGTLDQMQRRVGVVAERQ